MHTEVEQPADTAGPEEVRSEDIVIERDLSSRRALNSPKYAAKNAQNQQNYQNN